MKLEIKEIDGVPVTGLPDRSRTVSVLSKMSDPVVYDKMNAI